MSVTLWNQLCGFVLGLLCGIAATIQVYRWRGR